MTPLASNSTNANNENLDARRYFKQSEIILFRQAPEVTNGGQGALPPPPPENKIVSVPTERQSERQS